MPHKDPEARKAYNARRYAENREIVRLERQAQRRDPEWAEREKERRRVRYLAKRDQILAIQAARYRENPEPRKAAAKAYRLARQATPEYKAMKRRWREANIEKARRSSAEWKKRNADREADAAALRRGRIKTAGPVEKIDRRAVLERDRGICHLCGDPVDPRRWHLDHVRPIARGGTHTYDNVAVSHPICNQRKNDRLPDEIAVLG